MKFEDLMPLRGNSQTAGGYSGDLPGMPSPRVPPPSLSMPMRKAEIDNPYSEYKSDPLSDPRFQQRMPQFGRPTPPPDSDAQTMSDFLYPTRPTPPAPRAPGRRSELVGQGGPQVFVPPQDGSIVPNNELPEGFSFSRGELPEGFTFTRPKRR